MHRSISSRAGGLALVVFAGMAGLAALAWYGKPDDAEKGLSAPDDPAVVEEIRQVRGLQKVGRWDDAAERLLTLAQAGHPEAMYHLGRAYKNGWGLSPDLEAARDWFGEAVRFAFRYRPETAYELGRLFQRAAGSNCNEIAVQWFLRSLDWGNRKAHVQLAKHFERGLGVERDIERAFDHYEQAAVAGYPTSTINYARILEAGRYGLEPDREGAAYWAAQAITGLKRKAQDGSPSAAKTIGRLYRDGEFLPRDSERAVHWFRHASTLGDLGAMHDLGAFLLASDPDEPTVDEAIGWLRLAAENAHGGAATALGRLHLKGRHGLEPGEAVGWFEKGLAQGHAGAMAELARLYADGLFVERDLARALQLAERGAAQDHQGSKSLLETLRQGEDVNLEQTKASPRALASEN